VVRGDYFGYLAGNSVYYYSKSGAHVVYVSVRHFAEVGRFVFEYYARGSETG